MARSSPVSNEQKHARSNGRGQAATERRASESERAVCMKRVAAYWCAANCLSVGQIDLMGNSLLKEPLSLEHVKPRLLGHWGTTPGLNFIYVHLNRVIKERDLNMIFLT